jgi:hypothetical protein
MFKRQRYNGFRSLYILDDAGQFEDGTEESGEDERGGRYHWYIDSRNDRYPTLGAKRNACAELASKKFNPDFFVVSDDDDIYLPRHFADAAEALAKADWSYPSRVLNLRQDGSYRQHLTGPGTFFHSAMAFRRSTFEKTGGYVGDSNWAEDQLLFRRFEAIGATIADPLADGRPATCFWTGHFPQAVPHASSLFRQEDSGKVGYATLGLLQSQFGQKAKLVIQPPPYETENPRILPEVMPRSF